MSVFSDCNKISFEYLFIILYTSKINYRCPMEATQSQSPGRSKPPPHHVGAAGREDAERHLQVKAKHHPHHHHYHHHHHHLDSQYNTESHSLLPYPRGSDTNGGEGGGGGGQYRRSEVGGQEWDLRVRLNRKAALSSRERERRGERQDERRGERQDERRGWGHVDNRGGLLLFVCVVFLILNFIIIKVHT